MNIVAYAFKDLKSQKMRTILGIFGVSISIFLLTTVSFLTDTVSYAYVDFLTSDSANIDFHIYTRWVNDQDQQLDWDFKYNELIDQIKASPVADEINGYMPRYEDSFTVNVTESYYTYVDFIALNVSYEKQIGYGKINSPGYDFETSGIPQGNCAISLDLASLLNVNIGDIINISRSRYSNGSANPNSYMNLTICAIFSHQMKFYPNFDHIVLIDIKDLSYTLGLPDEPDTYYEGRANNLYITLKNADLKYDVRNVDKSIKEVQAIGGEIQLAISYGYWVYMPKLSWLEYAQYITMFFSIVFVFIGLISMLIAGILISGILSTSVEERIREFGIFRCLGGRKAFNLKLVLVTGLWICLLGTISGVVGSWLFVSQGIVRGLNYVLNNTDLLGNYFTGTIRFVAQPTSVILSFVIGISVSLIVSITPAVKVMRMPIVQAINPYRKEENIHKLVRDQTVNSKLIMIGLLLAGNGSFIFFIIPRLALSMQMSALATAFLVILLVFLIGLTMAGLGLMPLLLRFWIYVFTPTAKKLMSIIRVSIFRHHRRNNSTILMFCLSFSFVIFTSSMLNIMLTQVSAMEEFQSGSPLVLYRRWGADLNTPNVDLQAQLMQVEGIEKTSAVIANPNQLSEIYSDGEKVFDAEIGDYIYLKSSDITIYGVDENYLETVYSQFIQFKEGEVQTSFEKIFNGSNTCIISQALSEELSLHLGDQVRMTFIRGDEQSIEIFEIVGVASKLTGFPRFRETGRFGMGNGVLISAENYINYMSIPSPAWVYKIYIDLRTDYMNADGAKEVEQEIKSLLGDEWSFSIANVIEDAQFMKNTFMYVEIGLQVIMSFTIVICMFGLFSSSYSSILERKREIGILRALGSRKDGISKLFTVESLIILLASGSTGAIVGYTTAALLSENMTLFTESPRLLTIPYMSLAILFGIAVLVMLIGMKILLKRVKKQNLIEIFRATT